MVKTPPFSVLGCYSLKLAALYSPQRVNSGCELTDACLRFYAGQVVPPAAERGPKT